MKICRERIGQYLCTVKQIFISLGIQPAAVYLVKLITVVLICTALFPRLSVASDDSLHASRLIHLLTEEIPSSSVIQQSALRIHSKSANFEQEQASQEAKYLADWVVDSGDNRKLPFIIIDKKDARIFVFYANGRLRGAAMALLGLTEGDVAVPGIGNRHMSNIRPEERTTPAGRFVASLGRNMSGTEILWVDYDSAISIHSVITTRPKERRLQRLATRTPLDNRISYGCINVPAKFYKKVVHPAFYRTDGIVYVLPEIRSIQEVFGSYDVEDQKLQKQ